MEDIYRILVPTDYSETADHALNIGVTLAKRNNALLHILHIEGIPSDWVDIVEKSEGTMHSMIKEQLDMVKKQLSDRVMLARDKGAQAESFLEYNKGYRAIVGHAENYEIDLIVMGGHGRSGLKGLLMGSYTQRVVHHSPVPVLAMKKADGPGTFEKMVFVSDYSPIFANSIHTVVEFATRLNIKLHLLFLNTKVNFRESDDIETRMNEYVQKAPEGIIESVDVVNSFLFEDGLIKYCEHEHIDIVSMIIHGKNRSWEGLGSTVERLVNRLDIPVLGIPERQ